ncbi:LysE family translocator [Nordella sp. HKS 07]|uniref:LysE family translocator n=1 Tax=Nordella sp. HKS 07 TaxID=2712222 RepID=UPI0013E1DFE5|nr:LysE family translocator [Nordella sp. HKS 07]QIG46408.1 LysE family translocator [Nordella sp. HKS 07]
MGFDLFWALLIFTIVMTFTPGPNTMMLLASGVNFGFRATVPHMVGITLGMGLMTILVGLGLGELFQLYPSIYTLLGYAGAAYMLFLAWKIATATSIGEGRSSGRPMSFLQAAAFQWVNPKAWVMAVTAITTYSIPESHLFSVALLTLTFMAVSVPGCSTWILFGTGLRRWLEDKRRLRIFNVTMAVLLVLSLVPAFWHG